MTQMSLAVVRVNRDAVRSDFGPGRSAGPGAPTGGAVRADLIAVVADSAGSCCTTPSQRAAIEPFDTACRRHVASAGSISLITRSEMA
jgi:hypothetical protein